MAATQNPDISATELEIKRRGRRRLIGAITIGLLAIVFLPMIFDSEPKRAGQPGKTQDISVQVPSKEGQPPLPAPAAAPIVVAPSTATPPATATAPPAPAAEAPKVAAVVTDAPKTASVATPPPTKEVARAEKNDKSAPPEKAAKAEPAKAAEKTGFVVQLGVFTDADNAKQAVAKVKEAKLTVYTESIPVKSGNATRVRVGPFATREKADAALAQVKLAGADGKIVPLK